MKHKRVVIASFLVAHFIPYTVQLFFKLGKDICFIWLFVFLSIEGKYWDALTHVWSFYVYDDLKDIRELKISKVIIPII